jgi:cytochrome c-type biogenesis protein CcmF
VIPELGQFALVLALTLCIAQAVLPLAGAATGRTAWMALARPAAAGQFVFVALAYVVLTHAFLTNDFSLLYVAMHSNTELPVAYKFAGVWGGHEGSLLLWSLMLALWTLAVAWKSHSQPAEFTSRVLGVLGIVSAGVLAFTLLTSNPFDRLVPPAWEGNDLNPLLQDPAMVIHPPMLFMGYVGLSVPFAFAVAALLSGRLTREWARWTRPWTVAAWCFLTLGISLGSWWAYYELGWGGWWFWDPVENASFMPWLIATALIHSLAVTERRGIFKSWTVLLAIAAFSLSLLGTFLVRSGVLISVHAFASDPSRGLFILLLMGVICGGALLLYAARAPLLKADAGFQMMSRETFLLANNILLVVATLAVLLGTLWPLFLDALGLGRISVGPPYFDFTFLIPMLPLVLLLGIGMHTAWKSMRAEVVAPKLLWPAAISIGLGFTLPLLIWGSTSFLTLFAVTAGIWVCVTSLLDPVQRWLRRDGAMPLTRAHWGMCIAHLGVGLFVIGATVVSAYDIEADIGATPGDSWETGGYEFVFRGTRDVTGPNYDAVEGEFELRRNGRLLTLLTPQKRIYRVQTNPMTQASIHPRLDRDVFIAMGEPLGAGAWSLRVQVKPMVRFIWIGTLVMALGGLLALTDRRYRVAVREPEEAPARSEPAGTTARSAAPTGGN